MAALRQANDRIREKPKSHPVRTRAYQSKAFHTVYRARNPG